MPRCLLAALIFCLLAEYAHALPLSPTAASPGEQCRTAIAAAERGHGVPPQLLAAIGRVESGRRDPGTGMWGAWPWTINAEGQGSYFDSKTEAIQAVEALRARGVRSIDVGCMQVNLMHHPAAFPNLDMAFEPAVNADYAARFLVQLYGQAGDWTKATANYHSANPDEGGPYAAKVTSIWPEEQRKAGIAPPMPLGPGRPGSFASAVPPFSGHQPPRLFAMAGMPPVMMPPGTTPLGMTSPGTLSSRTVSPGTTAIGPASAGSLFAQRAPPPGRGLEFYRATPINVNVPIGAMVRLPNRLPARQTVPAPTPGHTERLHLSL
jgi:hypothetical protein